MLLNVSTPQLFVQFTLLASILLSNTTSAVSGDQLLSTSVPLSAEEITNSTCGVCGSSYSLGIGETLVSVAARCNVSVAELQQANPKLLSNVTGTVLTVPCDNTSPARCGVCGNSYVVHETDTLSSVAVSCGMALEFLENVNWDIDFENIYPGELIRVPCLGQHAAVSLYTCGVCGLGYTVTGEKESLSNVTKRCKTSVQELVQENPGLNTSSSLIRGQNLRLPCKNGACGPCGSTYRTLSRETRKSVAAKCRVGFIELTKSNPSVGNWESLKAGTVIKVPCDRVSSSTRCSGHLCDTTFRVTKNNTSVSEVATACNVTAELISLANDIPVDGLLPAGESLSVPCEDMSPVSLRSCSICGSKLSPATLVDLETVSKACGVSVSEIQRATNTSLTTVAVGDVVSIPCEDHVANCGPCGIGYRAGDGDTVSSIAVRCGVRVRDIKSANPSINFSQPFLFEIINVPCSGFDTSGAFTVSSETGSTLTKYIICILFICIL